MAVSNCPACGQIMSDTLDRCPHCGSVLKKDTNEIVNDNDFEKEIVQEKKKEECNREEDSTNNSQTIVVEPQSSLIKDLKNIWNKRNIILMSVGAVVIIAAIFVVVLFNNKTSKFYKNVEANNIEAAKSIYDKDIRGNEKRENEVKAELIQQIDKYKTDYIDKQISYEDGKTGLDNLNQLDIVNSECADALSYMKNLNDSRTAYEDATRYADSSDYYSAIEAYKKVIEVDSNYQEAKNQILNLTESYKAQILEQVEQNISSQNYDSALNLLDKALKVISDDSLHAKKTECIVKRQELEKKKEEERLEAEKEKARAKKEEARNNQLVVIVGNPGISVQSDRYKSLYPDMLTAVIQNNADKTIKDYVVGFLAFDSNGYPVKFQWNFDVYGDAYEKTGSAPNSNVVTGATSGSNTGWEIDYNPQISRVLACVKSATFYDGSTWKNPYYTYWIEDYMGKPLN